MSLILNQNLQETQRKPRRPCVSFHGAVPSRPPLLSWCLAASLRRPARPLCLTPPLHPDPFPPPRPLPRGFLPCFAEHSLESLVKEVCTGINSGVVCTEDGFWLSVSKCQLDVHPRVYPSFRVFGACSGAFWLVLMLRGHLPFWLFLSYERAFFSPLEGVWESWRVFSVPSVLKSHRVSWWEPCCCVVYWPIQTNDVCPSGLSHFGYYYWDSFLLVTVMSLFCLFFFF